MTDCVRRRRLVRVAIKLKSRPGDPLAPAKAVQMPPGAAPASATAVPAAPVVVAEPVGGVVGPIVVPPGALPPQQTAEAPSPAPVPAASHAAPSTGGTTLVAFLQSVRCEQYTKALVDLGASEVADLKDMQVSIALVIDVLLLLLRVGGFQYVVCVGLAVYVFGCCDRSPKISNQLA